jgi:hypothetical protein
MGMGGDANPKWGPKLDEGGGKCGGGGKGNRHGKNSCSEKGRQQGGAAVHGAESHGRILLRNTGVTATG